MCFLMFNITLNNAECVSVDMCELSFKWVHKHQEAPIDYAIWEKCITKTKTHQ